jgi:hypothetical protein
MEPLRRWADLVINTTQFAANQLQQAMREQFAPSSGGDLTVTVSSFGFSRGMPPVADFVFDMRFLNNPHWDPVLRPMTGRDAPIAEFIRQIRPLTRLLHGFATCCCWCFPAFRRRAKPMFTSPLAAPAGAIVRSSWPNRSARPCARRIFTHNAAPQPGIARGRPRRRRRKPMTTTTMAQFQGHVHRATGVNTMAGNQIRSAFSA